jgi:hypothetical protein
LRYPGNAWYSVVMRRLSVETGDRYGGLTVVRELSSPGRRRVLCRCECGRELGVRLDHLRGGQVSCGRCGLEFGGERKTLAEWAAVAGVGESTLRARLKVMGLREALERGRG